ncbi:MAG TPA: hypothetical protein VHA10_18110, partial [Hypericibacter adhaerens]|uniref:hypothetical protein n=1 Tax=Hypericibacter adhaerens TaxID=2602016 RepID=UPI002BB5818C
MKGLSKHLPSKVLPTSHLKKKEAETIVIGDFLRRLGLSQFSIEPRERPDFLVALSGRKEPTPVACEITEYAADIGANGSMERRLFALWTSFAWKLRDRLLKEGFGRFYGAIHFQQQWRDKLPAADDIFIEEIVRALNQHDGTTQFALAMLRDCPTLKQHVAHITIRDTSPEEGVLWWCAHLQSGVVQCSDEALLACTHAKDKSANSYAWPLCKERWLVIHAAARGLADMAVLGVPPAKPLHVQNFDRVYLWDA